MAVDAFSLIIKIAMFLIFLRFLLQFAGLTRFNPFVRPAYQATQVVDLFSRIFPTVGDGRISLAALMLLLLLQLINITGVIALGGSVTAQASLGSYILFSTSGASPIYLFSYATFTLIYAFLATCQYLIFATVIISWIIVLTNSMHPILAIIRQLAEPVLAPFRRITPNLGVLDLSPLVALFAIVIAIKGVVALAGYILPMLG